MKRVEHRLLLVALRRSHHRARRLGAAERGRRPRAPSEPAASAPPSEPAADAPPEPAMLPPPKTCDEMADRVIEVELGKSDVPTSAQKGRRDFFASECRRKRFPVTKLACLGRATTRTEIYQCHPAWAPAWGGTITGTGTPR